MIAMRSLPHIAIALLACVAPSGAAHAEGLQVAPVSVTIPERSGVVWLNNGSERALRAQVRVFRWHQDSGEDELVETEDLVASPPFVEIAPGGEQVIRLVRFGTGADGEACERSYRIIVDELPPAESDAAAGLQYVLRYSVPVYLTNPACDETQQPALSWNIQTDGDAAWLNVVNLGQTRAQLANVHFVAPDGQRTAIAGGLLGYVLPGAERRFALTQSAALFGEGGQIEVQLNGSQTRQPVSLAPPGQ
jgi:fimbrial chaperone protein